MDVKAEAGKQFIKNKRDWEYSPFRNGKLLYIFVDFYAWDKKFERNTWYTGIVEKI